MNQKKLIFSLGTLCLSSIAIAQNSKPNIIFIFTDDLGYGDLGVFFQNQRAEINDRTKPAMSTPNIDRLASMGVQLRHHYCAAPVSAPSRGSLLTGLNQGHANVRNNQFDKELADNHTLATVLKTAGYSTAIFGKWGVQGETENPPYWPAHPNKRGFDYFLGYIRHEDGHEHYPKEGIYRKPKEVYENYNNITAKLDKCYTADLWTASAKKWIIEQKKNNKPFFAYIAYDTPHAVLELPTQAYPSGGGLKGGMQWIGKDGHMISTASGDVDLWIHPDYVNATYDNDKNPNTPEVSWPNVFKRYATDVRRIDDAVGDIMLLLKDLNIDQNTMIVFTSDNGPSRESYIKEPFNPDFFAGYGPFDGIKRDCWEGGVRVPAIACWPEKIPANRISNTPSINYDWLPTFAEMADIPAPANTDGVSLLPSLTGVGKQEVGNIYIEYSVGGKTPNYSDFSESHRNRIRNQMQKIRIGDYVGVRYDIKSHQDNFEIYNVVKDPQEIDNLAKSSEMDALQQKMKDKVLQLRRPDTSAKRPYDNELISSVNPENIKNAVRWTFYKTDCPWVPKLTELKSTKMGFEREVKAITTLNSENGATLYTGYIKVPADGEYTFSLLTSNASLLRIHDCTVIDNDYVFEDGVERSGTIMLKAGLHPFKLTCLQKTKKKNLLSLTWSSKSIIKTQIPKTNLFCDK